MILDSLLQRLDRPRKTGKGWVARCPAHDDHSPSLSIREGERGLLVHDFSGCSLDAICAALNIEVSDLFYAQRSIASRRTRPTEPRRMTPRETLEAAEETLWRGAVARELRGLRTLDLARGLDCSTWTDADFNLALKAVCRGYSDLALADFLHERSFRLRVSLFNERVTHENDFTGNHGPDRAA